MSPEDRDRLLEALLPHVPFDGWGEAGLRQAAADLGLDPAAAADALPNAAAQVAAFAAWADRQMLARLEAPEAADALARMKVRERVSFALKSRFELLAPHKEAVRLALRHYAFPTNAAAGLTALHRTSDAVWNAIGDASTDYNWYSKRFLLSGVISATTLYWLEDRSEDHARTWAFLDRQLLQVVKIGGRLGKGMKQLLSLPDRLLQQGMKAGRTGFGA